MQLRHRQFGGVWGLAYTLGTLGFVVFIVLKVQPIYVNEWKVAAAVKSMAASEPGENLKGELQKRWDIEDIELPKVSEVKMVTKATGKVLAYNYWSQVELFKGVFLSFNFVAEYPVGGAKY